MTIEQIVKLFVDNGVTLVVIGYFMYMNYRFNDNMTKTLNTISSRLEILEEKVLKCNCNDLREVSDNDDK